MRRPLVTMTMRTAAPSPWPDVRGIPPRENTNESSRVSKKGCILWAEERRVPPWEWTRRCRNRHQAGLGPHFTGHHDEPIDKREIAKIYDDVTGDLLPGHLVRAARQEDIMFLATYRVYERSPRRTQKGKNCVSLRWCDVHKGDSSNMAISSRLVGREIRWKDPFMHGTFAATPLLERLRYVLHWVQTCRRRHGRKLDIKLLMLDVCRQHVPPTNCA